MLLGTVMVRPEVPKALSGLSRLARNMYWSWNHDAQELFARLDRELWKNCRGNPVKLLARVSQERLSQHAEDKAYLKSYEEVLARFDAYLNDKGTWYNKTYPKHNKELVAYFSAEFGMHESLPIYSGGLGILSGDHLKAASDLGIPLVGVGLLYNHGYFVQRINAEGWQEAAYERLDFDLLPVSRALGSDGNQLVIEVEMPDRTVRVRVWKVDVGRVDLYLLDTDMAKNSAEDRKLSAQLYGGDIHMRIAQEKILGLGGVRALRQLGIKPTAWHMNEGHSAFLTLERLRELVKGDGLHWQEAVEGLIPSVCFTTHTPVPAGHDVFDHTMMEGHFSTLRRALGMDLDDFIALGQSGEPPAGPFSLTVLALRMARYRNGVSELHGKVSRNLWTSVWPRLPEAEVPIFAITNGVHVPTWIAPGLARLFDKHLGQAWRDAPEKPASWTKLAKMPNESMWEVHRQLKEDMAVAVRGRLQARLARLGESSAKRRRWDTLLNPDALTIGFARRFATYKRATLAMADLDRLEALLNDPERPVQLVFAGKAHPADVPGQRFIQRIYELSQDDRFFGKIVMVEDYDMELARHLVGGVDVWLNNPRRPLEASGTSGQKAALNGVLNFSVLDGWWAEGFNGKNGWAIGDEREYASPEEQDLADVNSLYATLEEEIIPLYYERTAGVPLGWVDWMKESIRSCAGLYSTHRMVQDYTTRMYIPAFESAVRIADKGYQAAREVAHWKSHVRSRWGQVKVRAEGPQVDEVARGEELSFQAWVLLGKLEPKEVRVEMFTGTIAGGSLQEPQCVEMKLKGQDNGAYLYQGSLIPNQTGQIGYGVRVRPSMGKMEGMEDPDLVTWAR